MVRDVRWWHRRRGVRLNAAIVAGVIFFAALLIAAFALIALTRAQLTDSVQTVVVARAQDLALTVASDELPDRIALSAGASAQIVDSDGNVLLSTSDIEGQQAMASVPHPPSGTVTTIVQDSLGDGEGEHDGEDGPFLIAIASTEDEGESVVVLVAATLSGVDDTINTLVPLLLVGVPLLSILVAFTTWMLAGRALTPVDEMSHEAEKISGADLERRIPLPGTTDEIQRLGETLNHMLERLEGSASSQRRFVSDASHELKSPISSLITMSEVAAAHPDEVDTWALANDVGFEARRLAILVDDLLTLARADEGAFTLDKSFFDLVEMVTEEASTMANGDIAVDITADGAVLALADRRRMAQVVRNLLDNGVRHAETRVTITIRSTADAVALSVRDDGLGVPDDETTRIFERFVRLDDGRGRAEGGTGLGLAVVREIVSAHGGQIEVLRNETVTGAVFVVRLPVSPSPGALTEMGPRQSHPRE